MDIKKGNEKPSFSQRAGTRLALTGFYPFFLKHYLNIYSYLSGRTRLLKIAINIAVTVLFVCFIAGCAATFSGTFIYEDEGLPNVQLTIHCDDETIPTTTSGKENDEGNFKVKVPKCKEYKVDFKYEDWVSPDPTILTKEEIKKHVTIDDVIPTSTIKGVVVDSQTSLPVKNAKIELLKRDRFGEISISKSEETDTEGKFDISGVRPGYYQIRIDQPPMYKIKYCPDNKSYEVRLGKNWDAGKIELEQISIY
jgi:hypothetical protein